MHVARQLVELGNDDDGWVCENHPDRPFFGDRACACGGASVRSKFWGHASLWTALGNLNG
jgi:hypothetical protein